MREYEERKVKDHLGISFLEMISQPRHVVDRMLSFSRETELKKLKAKNAEMARVATLAAAAGSDLKNKP